jgi:methylglyoxal synthase
VVVVNAGRIDRDRGRAVRPRRRTVLALVAHDAKKQDLLRLVRSHRAYLGGVDLMATGTTGGLIADELDLPVERMASGPAGGDLQIGARIADGTVDALIFLRDPLTAHPHEPDIQALLKVCDVRQVPAATNLASADILLHAMAGGRAGNWVEEESASGGGSRPMAPSPGEEAIRRRHPVARSRRLLRPVPDDGGPQSG